MIKVAQSIQSWLAMDEEMVQLTIYTGKGNFWLSKGNSYPWNLPAATPTPRTHPLTTFSGVRATAHKSFIEIG